MNPHYSIIIPVYNHLDLTIQCLKSIERNSNMKSLEIILVDDGSTDGTMEWSRSQTKKPNFTLIHHAKREGFTKSCNEGMKYARGNYIVLLNNDTLVAPDWLQHLENSLLEARRRYKNPSFHLVGPVSNDVAGMQQVKITIPPEEIDDFGPKYYSLNKNKIKPALFLSGFCVMFTRQLYQKIGGFDERFSPGGYEDRDFCLRARLEGYLGIIALNTFIYHHGHRTIDEFPELDRGLANRWKYFEKWRDNKPKKLVALYYVEDEHYLIDSLEMIEEAVDEIIIVDSTHRVQTRLNDINIEKVFCEDAPLGRKQTKEQALLRLFQLAQNRNADWFLLVGDRSFINKGFTKKKAQEMMNPIIPDILAYEFAETNEFDELCSTNITRFPAMQRNIPGYNFFLPLPEDAIRPCPILLTTVHDKASERLLHSVHTVAPSRVNDIALVTIMKDEAKDLDSFLEHIYLAFDEIILVDTGSKDDSKKIAERWGAKVSDVKWRDHFDMARNFALNQTNAEWIYHMDIDEKTEDIRKVYEMVNSGKDAFLFTIMDLQPGRKIAYPESIRLFRKMEKVHYEGMIHETVVESLTKIPTLKMDRATTRIVHYGRLRPGAKDRIKYYQELVENGLRRNPDDPLLHFHQALMDRDAKDMESALRHMQQAARAGWEKPNIRLELANMHLQAAYVIYRTLKDIDPGHPYYQEVMRKLEILRGFFPE